MTKKNSLGKAALTILLALTAGAALAQQPGPHQNAQGGMNPAATDAATGKPINLNYQVICAEGHGWIYFYRMAGGTAQQFPPQPLPPNMPNPCKR